MNCTVHRISFVKILYISTTFLPKDYSKSFTVTDSKALKRNRPDHRRARSGLKGDCVDFKRFRFALLKSGCGKHKRAAFLDYDTAATTPTKMH